MAVRVPVLFKGADIPSERERRHKRVERIEDIHGYRIVCFEGVPQLVDLDIETIRELLRHPDLWQLPATVKFYAKLR